MPNIVSVHETTNKQTQQQQQKKKTPHRGKEENDDKFVLPISHGISQITRHK